MRDLDFKGAFWFKVTEEGEAKTMAVFTEKQPGGYVAMAHANGALFDRGIVTGSAWRFLDGDPQKPLIEQYKAYFIPLDDRQVAAIKAEGLQIPTDIEHVESLLEVRQRINRQTSEVTLGTDRAKTYEC